MYRYTILKVYFLFASVHCVTMKWHNKGVAGEINMRIRLELNDQKYRIIKIQFLDFNDDNDKEQPKPSKQCKAEMNRCYRLN